jgi:hypothetical protein
VNSCTFHLFSFFSYQAAMSSDADSSKTCINEQVSDTAAVCESIVDEPTVDEPTSEPVVEECTSEPVGGDIVISHSEHSPEVSDVGNNENQFPVENTEIPSVDNQSDTVGTEAEVPVVSAVAECAQIASEGMESETPAASTTDAPSAVLENEDGDNNKNVLSSAATPALEQSSQQEPAPKARGGRSYQESRRSKKSGAAVGSGEKSKTAANAKSELRSSGDDDSSSSAKLSMSDIEHQGKGDVKEPAAMQQKYTDKSVDTNINRRPASDGDSLASGNKAAEGCDSHSG